MLTSFGSILVATGVQFWRYDASSNEQNSYSGGTLNLSNCFGSFLDPCGEFRIVSGTNFEQFGIMFGSLLGCRDFFRQRALPEEVQGTPNNFDLACNSTHFAH